MLLPVFGFSTDPRKFCSCYLVTSLLPWSHCCHSTVCAIGLHFLVILSTPCWICILLNEHDTQRLLHFMYVLSYCYSHTLNPAAAGPHFLQCFTVKAVRDEPLPLFPFHEWLAGVYLCDFPPFPRRSWRTSRRRRACLQRPLSPSCPVSWPWWTSWCLPAPSTSVRSKRRRTCRPEAWWGSACVWVCDHICTFLFLALRVFFFISSFQSLLFIPDRCQIILRIHINLIILFIFCIDLPSHTLNLWHQISTNLQNLDLF